MYGFLRTNARENNMLAMALASYSVLYDGILTVINQYNWRHCKWHGHGKVRQALASRRRAIPGRTLYVESPRALAADCC